jgi:hypothetical protein
MAFYIESDPENQEEPSIEDGAVDSNEEAFMKGYNDDEKIEECEECGEALNPDNRLVQVIDEEQHIFCSKTCAKEYEESIGD